MASIWGDNWGKSKRMRSSILTAPLHPDTQSTKASMRTSALWDNAAKSRDDRSKVTRPTPYLRHGYGGLIQNPKHPTVDIPPATVPRPPVL